MKYVSTRGEAKEASFENILASGTASDGGLFVPSVIPKLESAVIDDMKNFSYTEIAEIVIKPFICLLYTSPSPRDLSTSRMPSSA